MKSLEAGDHVVFSIFTATYNRAHILHRTYESLKAQTFRDFEWIIGDDGSTDETEALVRKWQQESEFPIRYFRQEHAGKNFVFNRGVREAKGEYFSEVDSDDALKPIALERADFYWRQLTKPEREAYFAVMFFCEDGQGKAIGAFFKESPCDYDYRKFNYSPKYRSDKWRCFRTAVLRQYPFREDVRNCHIFESTLFCEIAKKYKARFVNEVAHIYYQEGPSITREPKHPMQNLEGLRLSILYTLNNDLDFFFRRPVHFVRKSMNYARFSMHFKVSLARQWASMTSSAARLLWFLTLPVAFCIFVIDVLHDKTPDAARRTELSA